MIRRYLMLFISIVVATGCTQSSVPISQNVFPSPSATQRTTIPPTQTSIDILPTDIPYETDAQFLANLRHDWLQGLPCKAPCFHGITIGQSYTDVQTYIAHSPDLEWGRDYGGGVLGIVWKHRGTQAFTILVTTTHTLTSTVKRIGWFFAETIGFSDIMHLYGEPSSVAVTQYCEVLIDTDPNDPYVNHLPCMDTSEKKTYIYWITVYYEQIKLLFTTDLQRDLRLRDLDIETIQFNNAQLIDQSVLPLAFDPKVSVFVPWRAGKSIINYCRQAYSHESCQP